MSGSIAYDVHMTNAYVAGLNTITSVTLFLHNRVRWPGLQGRGRPCTGAQIAGEKQRDAGHLDKTPAQVILWLMVLV